MSCAGTGTGAGKQRPPAVVALELTNRARTLMVCSLGPLQLLCDFFPGELSPAVNLGSASVFPGSG